MPSPPDRSPFNRPRWTEQDAREVLAALRRSGKPVREFAAEHGLDPQRVYLWRRRLGEADPHHVPGADCRPAAAGAGPDAGDSVRDHPGLRGSGPRAAVLRWGGARASAGGSDTGPCVRSLPPSVRLLVATQPVDGRKGPDSLMALVRDVLRHDPLSGHLFIFFSKRCDRVRIVYWDRNGFAMWTKRLEKGRFRPTFSTSGHLSSARLRLPSWR